MKDEDYCIICNKDALYLLEQGYTVVGYAQKINKTQLKINKYKTPTYVSYCRECFFKFDEKDRINFILMS